MSIITTPKERRKRQPEDPWDYADDTSVTMAGQAQPPAGMVTAPQQQAPAQVQAQLAPPAPNAAPQPFYPAPVQAQPDPNAVTPPLAPQGQWNATGDDGQPIAQPATNPAMNAPPGLQQEAQQRQELIKKGGIYTPEGMLKSRYPQQAPAPAKYTPRTTLLAPDLDPEVSEATQGDQQMSRYQKRHDDLQKRLENASPKNRAKIEAALQKNQKDADARVEIIGKAHQQAKAAKEAETADKIAKETKAAEKANAITDAKKRTEAVNLGARKQANAAGKALTAGDPDEAIRLAEAAKEQYATADNTIFTDLDQTIAKAQAAKKAAADKTAAEATKQKDAENKRAARAMQPQVDRAKNDLADAQSALNAANALLKTALLWNDATGDEEKDAATKAKVAEIRKSIPVARAARNQASARLSEVTNLQKDAAEGIEQPEPAADPNQDLMNDYNQQANAPQSPPVSQPAAPATQPTAQGSAINYASRRAALEPRRQELQRLIDENQTILDNPRGPTQGVELIEGEANGWRLLRETGESFGVGVDARTKAATDRQNKAYDKMAKINTELEQMDREQTQSIIKRLDAGESMDAMLDEIKSMPLRAQQELRDFLVQMKRI